MQEILERMLKLQIKLWVDGDRLCYSAPPGVMDEARRAELTQYKPEIIAYLKKISRRGNVQPKITSVTRPEKIPLSYAQELPWQEDQLVPGNTANNMFYAFRLRGCLDVNALQWAFQKIVERHEILRTAFNVAEGQPYQQIAASLPVSITILDVSSFTLGEIENLLRDESRRPFDLSCLPLVRCSLLQRADDEHILLLTIHHIISDGWSVEVLFGELILLSCMYTAKKADSLPPLPLQYADFAIQQRNWLKGDVFESQVGYWKKQLEGAPLCLGFPSARQRPEVHAHRGARLPFTLPRKLTDDLKTLSYQEDVTLFMTLLAAFQAALARWSGQPDISIGSPVVNRKQPELEHLIGFFANTLVLRTDCSGNPTFCEMAQRVREVCLEAYDHQDVPFGRLVDELKIPENMSYTPLFQVMFNLQNTQTEMSLPGLIVEPVEVDRNTTHFDLRMSLQESASGLSGFIKYNVDLFDQETIQLLIAFYKNLLTSWVENPDLPLMEICFPDALQAKVESARKDRE